MKPNIIFYFSDQQRYDTLGCYGQKLNVTPNIDKLAKDGVIFNNAFTCQPVCGPARACLQTGEYATKNGCFTNGISLDFSKKNLADYFNEAGYQTAYIGKWHLASDNDGEDYTVSAVPESKRAGYKDYWMAADVLEFTSHGYDGYVFDKENNKVPFTGYRADSINNYAINFLQNYNKEQPFFMFVSQIEPHQQNDRNCYEAPDGYAEKFKDYEAPKDLPEGEGNWEKEYANYLGCCHSLDENVGRLINTLKKQGLYENTIIIYTSDHGCHFKTRNREYKRSCHDSSIHIPMIMHGPGIPKGKVYDSIVSLIDIPPTILDFAGIEVPGNFAGYSTKDLIAGNVESVQDEAFIQIRESQISRAIRTKEYKYCVRAVGDAWSVPNSNIYYEFEFYDLTKDPYEKNNLINDTKHEEIRNILRQTLITRMVKAGEQAPEICKYIKIPEEIKNDGYDYRHI